MPGSWPIPRTPDALHHWIADTLDLRICRRPLLPGHQAPFDYLCHTFFEGAPSFDAIEPLHAPAPQSPGPSHPRDLVLWANRGGGKTFLGAIATTLDLVFKPGIQVRILAGSVEQASRMFAHLRRFFAVPVLTDMLEGRATARRITLQEGSTVEILAASEMSVRGTRVQKIRCDEVDLFDPELWQAAQLTTLSRQCGEFPVRGAVECLSTMHRPHGLMHRLVRDAAAGVRRLLKWGVLDTLALCPPERPCGPCPLLPECGGQAKAPPDEPDQPDRAADRGHIAIEDALVLKSRVSQAAWESEMLCLRPSRSHAVYPEFNPAVHVVDAAPTAHATWVAGMDFGFRAQTVILWGIVDDQNALWIVDERVQTDTVLSAHVQALVRSPDRGLATPAWIGVDPAGKQVSDQTGISSVDVLEKAGLVVRVKQAGLGVGLEMVRARLRPASGPVRLRVHARCTHLIEALERYHYPDDDPESMTPVKDGPDHAADALRYLVVNLDKRTVAATSCYARG